jgi:hypothetical protein
MFSSECTKELHLSDKTYEQDLLPNATQNILILAKKIQDKHLKSKGVKRHFLSFWFFYRSLNNPLKFNFSFCFKHSSEYLNYFDTIMKQFVLIHSSQPYLIIKIKMINR